SISSCCLILMEMRTLLTDGSIKHCSLAVREMVTGFSSNSLLVRTSTCKSTEIPTQTTHIQTRKQTNKQTNKTMSYTTPYHSSLIIASSLILCFHHDNHPQHPNRSALLPRVCCAFRQSAKGSS